MNFAQAVPGRNDGRGSGIIDVHNFGRLLDGVGLIKGSAAWKPEDQDALEKWFDDYLTWLLSSKNGVQESKAKNNHGTWYDVQVVSAALFVGKNELAVRILNDCKVKRIAEQVQPDGQQPRELSRTRSQSYCTFNLTALFALASLGEGLGVDLWHYETNDGRSIRKTFDWLLPYVLGEKAWQSEQITEYKNEEFFVLLYQAAIVYQDQRYRKAAAAFPNAAVRTHRVIVQYGLLQD